MGGSVASAEGWSRAAASCAQYAQNTQRQDILSGPEIGKRKRVTRKVDGKLTLLVNLGWSWHEELTLVVTHFSLPILAYPFQGH